MNINKEIIKHADWKIRFSNAIFRRESLYSYVMGTLIKENFCELGRWLHEEGKAQYDSFPSYKACLKKHTEFHIEAEKVANAINSKQFINASKMIGRDSAFNAAVSEVCCEAIRLKKECAL
ncbi:MAG: CZB domain-containing protein [Methylobacter sp.]